MHLQQRHGQNIDGHVRKTFSTRQVFINVNPWLVYLVLSVSVYLTGMRNGCKDATSVPIPRNPINRWRHRILYRRTSSVIKTILHCRPVSWRVLSGRACSKRKVSRSKSIVFLNQSFMNLNERWKSLEQFGNIYGDTLYTVEHIFFAQKY